MIVGEVYNLSATVSPSNATNKTITWSSNNPGVASISSTGKVTAVGAGTATLYVNVDGKSSSCVVNVKRLTAEEIELNDFLNSAYDYEKAFFVTLSACSTFNKVPLIDVARIIKVFRDNIDYTAKDQLIDDLYSKTGYDFSNSTGSHFINVYFAEYELYSKGSSFADLMEYCGMIWSSQMKVFLSMLLFGITDALHPYDSYGDIRQDPRWYNEDGTIKWPVKERGFQNGYVEETLQKGTLVDRYGSPDGNFLAPYGTPFEQRSLPLYMSPTTSKYTVYRVKKDLLIDSGITAPWFGYPGRGIQYCSEKSIRRLVSEGYLEIVDLPQIFD